MSLRLLAIVYTFEDPRPLRRHCPPRHGIAASLPTVIVTEAETVRRKSYHIGADEIESSKATLLDALDVVRKLRPDMLFGRVGPAGGGFDPCTVRELWVNGEHVQLP